MSEWTNCPKCGTLMENLCACPKCEPEFGTKPAKDVYIEITQPTTGVKQRFKVRDGMLIIPLPEAEDILISGAEIVRQWLDEHITWLTKEIAALEEGGVTHDMHNAELASFELVRLRYTADCNGRKFYGGKHA